MKDRIDELALFGGSPEFEEMLHVGRPNVPPEGPLLERIKDILARKWLTNRGQYVQEFERRIAEHVGARNCIAMCNATVALEITIRALGLRGEVIVPAFTFIATAHALQWQEIVPIFCDVALDTQNIDPQQIERMITPRTTGVIGVHLWGRPCDAEAICEIARRRNLEVIFDAAHAFGCSHRGRMVGNFGRAEVFSFHATKFLNSFEGGAVVTNDDELAEKIRLMKNFGFVDYDDVIHIGTNGKMTEVAAAMGLTSLERIEGFIAANRENYFRYRQELTGIPGVRMLAYDETETNNFHYIVLEIDEAAAGIGRDRLQEILWAENVVARRYFFPGCHRMEPYRSLYPHAGLLLPNTERLTERVLCLPTGTAVGAGEVSRVCQIIRMVIGNAGLVANRFAAGAARQPRCVGSA
jgi:dTDP-4-amino-4,6-dideoxygalactose transaminase